MTSYWNVDGKKYKYELGLWYIQTQNITLPKCTNWVRCSSPFN